MKKWAHILFVTLVAMCAASGLFCSCQTQDDPTANLSFSADTLTFDTIFTAQGSVTRIVMLRNETKTPLTIERVVQTAESPFRINLDGEDSVALMRNIQLPAGDSLFLFVRANIDPQNSNSPVLVTDQLKFFLSNGNSRVLQLEAYGQDVTLIDSLIIRNDYVFTADKPYLVRYYIAAAPEASVLIHPGAIFYMHKNATIHFYGPLRALGTVEAPIVFAGDRLDDYVRDIPYLYVPGQWAGIYLYDTEGLAPVWNMQNVRILSAINGLFCQGESPTNRPVLELENARIHNHDQYGLVLINTDASVMNSEISNCASYCVYLQGGTSIFVHNTIAGYYRHTAYNSNVGLYDTPREDVASVYVMDL